MFPIKYDLRWSIEIHVAHGEKKAVNIKEVMGLHLIYVTPPPSQSNRLYL